MVKFYRKSFPITIGIILSIVCVLFISEFVKSVDFEDLEYVSDTLPYLCIGVISGLIGIPTFLYGVERMGSN